MRRQILTAGLAASVALASGAAFAAPCGPAVLASVDGQVLVNRGAGFLSGTAGMPLSVGDYVMSRGGNAQIAYVNGSAASLSGAKSMPITACSADAGNLTDPALAQFGTAQPTGGWTVVQPVVAPTVAVTTPGTTVLASPVAVVAPSAGVVSTPAIPTATLAIGGLAAAGAIAAVAVAANNGSSSNPVIVPPRPTSP